MRTNIVIDDKLMADVMALGEFKTKREAVEEGLRLLKRKKAYAALLAARGTLFWDDSDEGWAKTREQSQTPQVAVQEPAASYAIKPAAQRRKSPASEPIPKPRARGKSA
ncbi:MAG: type II toxin-antitoxin system VapB family antitoxin [Hydrogenophaga sp.]|jgi:Arc/MetJ family transcription regulator|uniref:type II toxin-antitoxin system VapB family antitoxin n=1 Tax=Hydrogenophaga sp. TaxID=1904254 RepID=UPI0025B86ADE|nr:type II toxin-antitoxin system VapB family antitoxin [Hydrogenophaga sp.]MDO9606438.1 type II toxin-antitoxin system VapB family antitoxin [Hydrogenophaga sp.]MDP2988261.1 type II toxin-antitoxin system VapB family antitoxin [Hydrogenophaga sp.]MDP3205191.1 type II toxin-antitoxin system VapB family antitoxin [Hydrogenophaga sp.]MDP3625224.1 type II toxin-antitoxin system VapB family antitoxin [Hydrogenophaga sp.]